MLRQGITSEKRSFISLHPADNTLVSCRHIAKDEKLILNGATIVVKEDIPVGHKISCETILQGAQVIKYGVPIGSAVCDIDAGEHVHIHNLRSDYIAGHSRAGRQKTEESAS